MAVRTGFLLLALCLIIGIGRAVRPRLNISDIDLWVTTISNDLTNFRSAVLGADSLETSYKASGVSAGAVNDTQASLLLQTVKNRIQALMWRSEKQVEIIRSRAEELFAGYSARNFSCSAFTSPPYSRATAVVKLDPASPTPAPSGVDYCNQIATLDLRPDPRLFDAETDRNTSTSQVAQFVYHASNEILNAANWTADLEAKMKQNAADDQTVQWQYFCSKQGLMKIYPGVQWFPQNLGTAEKGLAMDPFDCRNQNWYLMSETYPKDLVLVIDNSGSMMGSGSIMANRTMTEFFATLTANDYFNVLLAMGTQTTSASYVRYVTDVYNGTLLQATDANKNKMMELFNEDRAKLTASSRNLQAQGLADLGGALTEAFQLLRLVKESKTAVSAGGVQAIALVTDSTPEDYAAVFAKFNPDRQVRLFTYLMGQEARDAPVVKSMACANRGYFGQVSTMSDAKATVLHYLPVMARPNSKSQHRFFTWSDVHQNQIPTVGMSDNAKRALFTSVSQAAYDIRRNSTVNAGVIGVAGADLAMNQFDQLGPAWELGPLAYIFIVNNNGFVIYHPELRTIDSSGNPLLFYSSRDIASIEVPADSVPVFNEPDYNLTLRTALVQRQTGTFDFARIRLYNGNSRSQRITYRYLTTPLLSSEVAGSNSSRQTPFSLGLALPWQSGQQWPLPLAYTANASNVGANLASAEIGALLSTCLLPVVSTGNLSACQPALSLGVGLSSNFEFCDFSESLRAAFSANPVCAAAQALAMNQTAQAGMSCSAQFLSRLRVDAAASLDSPNVWRAAFAVNSSTEPARLLGATGGYTFLWCGGSGLARWLVDPALNGSLSMPRWQNGTRDQLYERTVAMATDEPTLSVALTPPSPTVVAANAASNATFPRAFPVLLTAPIRVAPGAVAAVGGAELDYARLEAYFTRVTNSCSSGATCNTCAQASVSCYLLDLSGIVVASKRRQDVGKSFDWVNCDAAGALINQRLYYSVQSNDYQSVCYRRLEISRAASSLLNPFKAIAQLVAWILLEGFLILSDLSASLMGSLSADAQMTNASLATRIVYASRATIGCQSYSLLQANSTALAAGSHQLNNITCSLAFTAASFAGPCISDIYVKQVSKTNLVFVAVALDTGCQCQGCSPSTGPKEMETPANYSLQQVLRRKPDWTRPNIVLTDNSTLCTSHANQIRAPSAFQASYWLLLTAVLILWLS